MNTFSKDNKITETHILPFAIDESYVAFIQAINDREINKRRFTVKDASWNLYCVTLHTRGTSYSWGEIMVVQFTSVDAGTEVSISSQFPDYDANPKETVLRKNKKNIADILGILKCSCYGEK